MRDITEALSWHHEPISNDTQDEEKVDTGHHYRKRHAYSMASVGTILPCPWPAFSASAHTDFANIVGIALMLTKYEKLHEYSDKRVH